MPETQSKIAIVTFNQGAVHHAFAAALAQTFATSFAVNLIWIHMPTSDKNVLLPMIDRSNVDIVVWINSNIIWSEAAFAAVLDPLYRGVAKVAGCVYHAQREDGGLIPVKLEFLSKDLDPLRGYVGPTYESGRFMYLRARHLPFGFLAMKRETLTAAAASTPKYTLHNEGERETHLLFTERVEGLERIDSDHIACDYLREKGAEIWVCMDEAVLQAVGGRLVGKPGEPPRIHEFAAEVAKSKVKK